MSGWKLRSIKTATLKDRVKQAIRESIFQGRYRPGDPLRELDLASDLRVSQSTVREALFQLEQTGLVLRVPNKETIVTRLSQQDLRERVSLRILIEAQAAVEAARHMTAADIRELERHRDLLAAAAARKAYFDASQADLGFHRLLWEKSGNRTMAGVLDNLTAPLFAFASILRHSEKQEMGGVAEAHQPIIDAVARRKPAAIRESICLHIEGSYNDFLAGEWEDFGTLMQSRSAGTRKLRKRG
jgi:DNA-binding GntR family transcriptional regulator